MESKKVWPAGQKLNKCNHYPTLKKLFKEKCKECKEKYGFIAIAHVVDNAGGIYGANVNSSGNQ
jgi:hypothetical protein